jgi:hypothetical protein
MPSRALRKLQLGQEVTPGVLVSATTVWGGPSESIEDDRDIVWVKQDIGRLSPGLRTYTSRVGALYDMPETEATYEQLVHILQASFGTSAATNDGSGRVRTYSLATSVAVQPKTYTLESGDDTQAYRMGYCFVPKFKLSGKLQEAVMASATWQGREKLKSAFTNGLAVPANIDEVMFGNGRLYIDDAAMGATQKTGTLLGFDLDVETGLTPRYAADGNLYYSTVRQGVPSASLKITFEHEATSVSEEDKFVAEALRLIRLEFRGPSLATAGTNYTTKLLRIDMAGKWSKFSKLGEDKGINTVQGTFDVGDDGTNFLKFVVVNEDNTIP